VIQLSNKKIFKEKRMKKMFLVLLLILIFTGFVAAIDVHNFTAVKLGYGNETGGTGVAIEFKANHMGLVAGAGYFGGNLDGSIGLKGYIDTSDTGAVFASINYGMIGYEWSSLDGENITVYAPYFLIGYTGVSKSGFFYDASLGYGSAGKTKYWDNFSQYTGQASIGYAY